MRKKVIRRCTRRWESRIRSPVLRAPLQVWPRENLRRYEVEVALWDDKVQAVAFQNQSRHDRFSRNGRLGNYSPPEFALAHRFDLGILVGELQDHRRNPLRPVGRTFLRIREPSLLLDLALVTMPSFNEHRCLLGATRASNAPRFC
jgi:hypothetical protein